METGFVLSMELSADLMFRAKWTNTIMSSSGLHRSFKFQVNTKLLMECCLGALRPSQDGEGEWSRVG